MRLLVSVTNAGEAASALAGGADIVDAKDPTRGALGAVSLDAMTLILRECRGRVPVSAALGDVADGGDVSGLARRYARSGAVFVKLGFAGMTRAADIERSIRAVVDATRRASSTTTVVAVAYADAHRVGSATPEAVLRAAIRGGAGGVLLDTADKSGPGLRRLMSARELLDWVALVRASGLTVAVAGKLVGEDLSWLAPSAPDIVGVRGAACDSGRLGVVSPARISELRARCAAADLHARPLTSRLEAAPS